MSYEHLTHYQRADNYAGATWYGYYDVAGTNRDADTLQRSNFECWTTFLTELLGPADAVIGHAEKPQSRSLFGGGVSDENLNWTICEENHRACGWVKVIRVHEGNPQGLLAQIDDKLRELEGYPVFNEDHFSALEDKERWDNWCLHGAAEEFRDAVVKQIEKDNPEGDAAEEIALFEALSKEKLWEFYEELAGHSRDSTWPDIRFAIRELTWENFSKTIETK